MTKKEVAILSFKVLSVYAFIKAIDRSYDFLYYFFYRSQLDEGSRINLELISIPSLLYALCGIALWFAAPLLATSIFKSAPPEEEPGASSADIQEIAFSIVGLFVLAISLPDLVRVISIMLTSSSYRGARNAMIHSTVVLAAKSVLGFWLLLGSHGVVKFVRSMRRD